MDEILRVEHLTKHFTKRVGMPGARTSMTVRAADDVTFSLRRGEVFVLAGGSGSGKSTVVRMILGSVTPDSGRVLFEGEEVVGGGAGRRGNKGRLRKIRMNCQMIHQDPYDSVNPRMRVADIVSEPLQIHGVGDGEARMRRVISVLREVRLEPAEAIAGKHPHMLSGGQRQRVVLARALALSPKVILADEPVSMLDVSIRAEMLEMMRDLQRRHDISFVYITHDLATARYFGQRMGVMYMGKMVEVGPIGEVLRRPRHPYTQALIDAVSEPDPGNLHRDRRIRMAEGGGAGEDLSRGCRFRPMCTYAIEKCAGTDPGLEPVGGGDHNGNGNGSDDDNSSNGRGEHLSACHVDIRSP